MMLLQVISDAEDSRNLLMLSQKSNVNFIKEQQILLGVKLLKGINQIKLQSLNEIRGWISSCKYRFTISSNSL